VSLLNTLSRQPVVITVWAVVSMALLSTPSTAQGRIDVLNSRDQIAPLAGATVVRETLQQVSFQRGGPDSKVETRKTELVVRVVYGQGSAAWEAGLAAREGNRLQEAATLFTTASHETEPSWVAPVALLELAEIQALRGPENLATAQTAVERFLAEYSDHRLLPRALLLSARIAAQSGRMDRAREDVQKVIDLAQQKSVTPDWAVRSQITLGQELLSSGDGVAAGDAFAAATLATESALRDLGRRADLLPAIEALGLSARSGAGGALLAQGQISSARSFFQQLAQDGGDDPAIAAAAGNGLAEADFKDNKLKDAQLGFTRIAVTGASIPDQHAKALYYLGRCASALDQKGQEKNGRQMARDYFSEVQARYPASHWARLSQQSTL
jgi:TolA-binding protein